MTTKTDRIRALNDELRQFLLGGMAVITPGIAALGPEAVDRIVKTIAVFDDFCQANDPHEEHDFGAFDAEGKTIMFKIDYYDRTLTCHSPDPSDASVTERVITIMLAEDPGEAGGRRSQPKNRRTPSRSGGAIFRKSRTLCGRGSVSRCSVLTISDI